MKWEVFKIHSDIMDSYGNICFDGYQLYGFQDGYLGDDNKLLEERFVNLKEYKNSIKLRDALISKLAKYERTNWVKVSDPVEFGNNIRQRIAVCDKLIDVISGEEDE